MVPQAWVEKQVFSMNLKEIKQALGRTRLRLSKIQICQYLLCLQDQHIQMKCFKSVFEENRKALGVGYAGFMYGLEVVAPLWRHLVQRHQRVVGIGFDGQTIVDSSLLPCKQEQHITKKDWDEKRVTIRKKDERSVKICGEKLLTFINSQKQIVVNTLMDSINSSDQNVLKHPMQWASKGLKKGFLLADRGFPNKKVYEGLAFLRQTLSAFTLELISPPHPKQNWELSPEQKLLYKKRWQIEELYRQLKDPLQPYRLILKGVRRRRLRQAKVEISTLAWNWRISPVL